MYVCICNAVTEGQVRQACQEGARTLKDLQNGLGVATGCGQCAGDACNLLGSAQNSGADSISIQPQRGGSGGAV